MHVVHEIMMELERKEGGVKKGCFLALLRQAGFFVGLYHIASYFSGMQILSTIALGFESVK